MTTLKTIAITCLTVSGLAMAQGAAPVAPRTGLYGSVTKGNIAADNTVDDYSKRPTLIGDKQYFAGFTGISGTDMGNAAFSVKAKGFNWFGAVTGPTNADTGSYPDIVRLGLGAGSAWGAGLLLAVNRQSTDVPAGTGSGYFETSGFGAFADFSLGASDVYGLVSWNTGFPPIAVSGNPVVSGPQLLPAPHISSTFDPSGAGSTTVENHHMLSIMAGWKKDATTEGTHSFNVEASYIMAMHTDDAPNPDIDDNMNILSLMPMWGYILRANNDYSVFVGTNTAFIFEKDKVGALDGSRYLIGVTPNIAFQKQFGHGFEGFSGFSVTGVLFGTSDAPVTDESDMVLFTGYADVSLGLRWVKDNFAVEGSLRDAFLSNGPYLISGVPTAGGLFASAGLSLGF